MSAIDAVHGQPLDARVGPGAEEQPEHADDETRHQDLVAVHAEELAL